MLRLRFVPLIVGIAACGGRIAPAPESDTMDPVPTAREPAPPEPELRPSPAPPSPPEEGQTVRLADVSEVCASALERSARTLASTPDELFSLLVGSFIACDGVRGVRAVVGDEAEDDTRGLFITAAGAVYTIRGTPTGYVPIACLDCALGRLGATAPDRIVVGQGSRHVGFAVSFSPAKNIAYLQSSAETLAFVRVKL